MLQTEQAQDVLVVRPGVDIVASQVEQLKKDLQALVAQGHIHLVIDLEGTSMIDSKGLAVFMLCHKSVSARGGSLKVVTANRDFRQLFHITRMDEHFKVVDTL